MAKPKCRGQETETIMSGDGEGPRSTEHCPCEPAAHSAPLSCSFLEVSRPGPHLVGACFCSSSSSVSLLMVMTLTVGLGVSGMTIVCRCRSLVVLEAPSPHPHVTEELQAGLLCTRAQRGGVFSLTRFDR